MPSTAKLSVAAHKALLATLKARFEKHPNRHSSISWEAVEARLAASPAALLSLAAMEETGGEPDVIGADAGTGVVIYCDCSAETPKGRRSLCYDDNALEARKEHKPAGSAAGMAASMGVELLDEDDYRALQALGPVDTKTSSWLATPEPVRAAGGAIFGDYRFGRVFVYHNGVQSYYGGRGFRGKIRV